jgi:N-acyl homoserine lactone hydrolase
MSPVVAFLVEHPGVGKMLVDTGLHPSVAVKPRENLGRIFGFIFRGLEMTPEQSIPAQLRERGIDPSKIRTVLMTHLHPDHASGISEFPDATFVVSSAEWEAASSGGERQGYVKRQFDHGFDYRLLDFDDARAQGYSGFGRTFDLFGDGSVRAAFTPGHSRGHMSFILRTGERELLVAGDAIFLRRTLETGTPPWLVEDAHLFRRSLREIQLYQRSTPDAVIVPGHDADVWRELAPMYG